nr:hybrid sensor histidine kinase/response regulator [uncultured bacterium]
MPDAALPPADLPHGQGPLPAEPTVAAPPAPADLAAQESPSVERLHFDELAARVAAATTMARTLRARRPPGGGFDAGLARAEIDAPGWERRPLAERLRASEARFHALVEVAGHATWSVDAGGRVVAPQPAWQVFTGQTFAEARGADGYGWADALHPEDRDVVVADLRAAAARGDARFECRVRIRRAPGAVPADAAAWRHTLLRMVPVLDPDGRVLEWVGTNTDVTALVAAEAARRAALAEAERARQEADAANAAKSAFLATMSHELRTPLNAIGGYAELLEMGIHGPVTDAQRQALARLQASQRHLLGLINEVLNFAKLENGTVDYAVADVRACDALAAAEQLVAPQARAKGLTLSVLRCAEDVVVRADPDKLRQVLVNLLSNAVKFTERDGRVELGCERAYDGAAPPANPSATRPVGRRVVRFTVRDTGIGIAANQLARIFEPFVQVRADLTRTAEGTGLGLAISRDLARGMGGDLTAESTPGVGSTFTLALPMS